MAKRHMMTFAKYPHFKLGKGRPYEGIENLRPESKEVVETFISWQPKKLIAHFKTHPGCKRRERIAFNVRIIEIITGLVLTNMTFAVAEGREEK